MAADLSLNRKYYKYFPFKFLVERIIKRRTERIVNAFEKFVEKGEKILDVGAGGGWIAKEIQKRKKAKVALLDVVDFNQSDLELILYDGKKMPFPENSFDVVLLIFVLHHVKNPLMVLKEARRITKNKIIIFEDTYFSFFDKIFLIFWDILTNLPALIIKPFKEKMPFGFKRVFEWKKTFKKLKTKLIFCEGFAKNKFINQTLFILKKCI